MNAEQLRDTLLDLLTDELGTYAVGKPTSPTLTPAIFIANTGDNVKRKVRGLECVIRRIPSESPRSMLGGVNDVKTWQLFLMQWEPPEGGVCQLQAALDKIKRKFVGMRSNVLGAKEQSEIREQVSVRIPDFTDYLEAIE